MFDLFQEAFTSTHVIEEPIELEFNYRFVPE